MKTVSILVPFFNEEANLLLHLSELFAFVDALHARYAFEILLLDNHSADGSAAIARQMVASRSDVRFIRQSRNFGYQANILTGYEECLGDCAVQLDADGEDDPKLILDFLKKWEEGYKVVYGVRIKRAESWFLTLQRKAFYRLLSSLSETPIPIDAGDFRLVDREAIEALKRCPESNIYLRGLLSYVGFKQIGVPYARRPRHFGVSKFTWFDYFSFAWDGITSFSRKPLFFIAALGLGVSVLSGGFFVLYLALNLFGQIPIRGFTTLIGFQLFLSGVQLLCLGVVAVYVGRIFEEVKRRPRYIIEERRDK